MAKYKHENGAVIELPDEHANLAEREGFVLVEKPKKPAAEKAEDK